MRLKNTLLFITLLLISSSATAIRCNSRLAEVGDPAYQFIKLCGQPDYVTQRTIYRSKGVHSKPGLQNGYYAQVEQPIHLEEWIYDFGPNRLMQKVIFIDGVASKITSLGYGSIQ